MKQEVKSETDDYEEGDTESQGDETDDQDKNYESSIKSEADSEEDIPLVITFNSLAYLILNLH